MEDNNNAGTSAPVEASAETQTPSPETEVADVVETSSQETQNAAEEQLKKEAEIKKALKSYELKVNGKSKKVDLDLDNEDQVKSYLQKALAADEKFQEASTYKKQAEQLVDLLQKDPLAILRNPALGIDIKKLAEQVLLEDLEEQSKSPEQRQMEEMQRKLKDYEERMAKEEESRKKAQIAQAQQRQQQEIEESIIKALDNNEIPAEPFFMRRLADIWYSAIESGWEDCKIEDVMEYAKYRMQNDFKSLIDKNKDPEKLEKLIGKEYLDGYRKSKVSKLKAAPKTASQVGVDASKAKKEEKPVKRVKITDIAGW